jgi:hypothetical protein
MAFPAQELPVAGAPYALPVAVGGAVKRRLTTQRRRR